MISLIARHQSLEMTCAFLLVSQVNFSFFFFLCTVYMYIYVNNLLSILQENLENMLGNEVVGEKVRFA